MTSSRAGWQKTVEKSRGVAMDGWQQQGMTLIEVLVAMALLGVGLFAVAGLQLRALQATDSALHGVQAAYLAHGMFEQVRAVGSLRNEDLMRFRGDVQAVIGPAAQASVLPGAGGTVVDIRWDESRGGLGPRSLSLAGQAGQ